MIRKKDKQKKFNKTFSWVNSDESMVMTVVEEMISSKKPHTIEKTQYEYAHDNLENLILLIEDSPIMRDFYRRILESYSFNVQSINEDLDEINNVNLKNPLLILIDDAGKPDEAIKISEKIRNTGSLKSIPVLLMLPLDIFKHFRKEASKYVDICIPKTFTPAILLPSLQSLLSS